jgi:hypothetical protein
MLTPKIYFAQEINNKDNSLNTQFDNIYETSTNYKTFKVISKEEFLALKQQVLDSIKRIKTLIIEKNDLIKISNEKSKKIQSTLNVSESELNIALLKENSLTILGIQLSKTFYSIILWSLILSLTIGIFYLIFKLLKNNITTKKAKDNLENIKNELIENRKKSLEREQQLRRKLQDEINKQRNS